MRSYRTVSPLPPAAFRTGQPCCPEPLNAAKGRYPFCCTILHVAATPCYGAPCPVVFGLSSEPASRSRDRLDCFDRFCLYHPESSEGNCSAPVAHTLCKYIILSTIGTKLKAVISKKLIVQSVAEDSHYIHGIQRHSSPVQQHGAFLLFSRTKSKRFNNIRASDKTRRHFSDPYRQFIELLCRSISAASCSMLCFFALDFL